MLRYFLICVILVFGIASYSQQKPVYSQYLFNALAINPAFAGSQDQLSLTAIYRNQWVNFPGAPQVKTVTGNSAIVGKKIGVGFILSDDQIGVHGDLGVTTAYAYRIRMPNGALSLGLSAGFNYLRSDFNKVTIYDMGDPNLTGVYNRFLPNFGTGIFYITRNSYIGFSVPSILNTKLNEDIFSQARQRRYYFLSAGKIYQISEDVQFKPSTLIRFQEKQALGVDINIAFIFQEKILIGNSYRTGDANISTLEFQFNRNFRLGYAYEYVLSKVDQFTQGSHEIMLNYRIDLPALQRTIQCPTFL